MGIVSVARREMIRASVQRLRAERRAVIRSMLGDACVICGSSEQLEVDHIDPLTKSFTIASGLTRRFDVFLAELEKCQVLCKPCHVIKSRSEVTHCKRGHPLTGENVGTNAGGRRRCLTCYRQSPSRRARNRP